MANITLPKITDYLDFESGMNIARIFFDPWITLLGSFFWGTLVLAIGVAIYLKTERIEGMMAWFILSAALGSAIFPLQILYPIGLLAGIGVGFTLFKLFFNPKE